MKNFVFAILFLISFRKVKSQEIFAQVQIHHTQIGGSNTQVFKTLEKSLQNFINNTSWTGKKPENFERIKSNFAIIISERQGQNTFKGSIIVQASRPVFNTTYETPLININDTHFSFDYIENENFTFNERQFSGKNLTDVIAFYVYLILGYDGDSFSNKGGTKWFEQSQRISQNSQNRNYSGWSSSEGQRTRSNLINNLLREEMNLLREIFYIYHRGGLDNLYQQGQKGKEILNESLLKLNSYNNNFQMNYPLNLFLETKKNEIFQIFINKSGTILNLNKLKRLMSTLIPKETESMWNQWK